MVARKLINDPENAVDEYLEGFLLAHPDLVKRVHERGIARADAPVQGKVAVVIGGGSGHKPAFSGYVGPGGADGAVIGDVFTSPTPDMALAVAQAVDGGAGVIFSYGRYQGDILNFDMAAELADAEGIRVETVLVTDDVASAPKEKSELRRGIAGDFFVFKSLFSKAESGASLDEVIAVGQKANERTRTMGVGLSGCTLPGQDEPNFTLPDGEMEIGLGIHGEPGASRGPIQPADRVVEDLLGRILDDMPLDSGSEVAVLVNGLGATPYMELYIMNRRLHQLLEEKGISVYKSYVGEYCTSLDMAGASITLLHLDDELKQLVDAPCDTPMFTQMQSSS
jgi:phosphoenolpyruvate---glycerone phosphotransferase subunit DhaK